MSSIGAGIGTELEEVSESHSGMCVLQVSVTPGVCGTMGTSTAVVSVYCAALQNGTLSFSSVKDPLTGAGEIFEM